MQIVRWALAEPLDTILLLNNAKVHSISARQHLQPVLLRCSCALDGQMKRALSIVTAYAGRSRTPFSHRLTPTPKMCMRTAYESTISIIVTIINHL